MKLVEAVLAGNEAAFDALLRPLEPRLRSFLAGSCRTRPDVDVEEVLQEVRIYLYRRLDRYNPEYPFDVFVFGLARNITKRFVYKKSDLAEPRQAPDSSDEEGEGGVELSELQLQHHPEGLGRALGAGRFAAPGADGGASQVFLEIFEVFLRYGGYPHQQVAFGFSVLLWGKAKTETSAAQAGGRSVAAKIPVTGDPDRVVREIGPSELGDACDSMLDEIQIESKLDPADVRHARQPLDRRLDMSLPELFARDVTSRRQFAGLGKGVTRSTRLTEYFGRDGRRSVADWSRGVRERVRKAFLEPSSRRRNLLPDTD